MMLIKYLLNEWKRFQYVYDTVLGVQENKWKGSPLPLNKNKASKYIIAAQS